MTGCNPPLHSILWSTETYDSSRTLLVLINRLFNHLVWQYLNKTFFNHICYLWDALSRFVNVAGRKIFCVHVINFFYQMLAFKWRLFKYSFQNQNSGHQNIFLFLISFKCFYLNKNVTRVLKFFFFFQRIFKAYIRLCVVCWWGVVKTRDCWYWIGRICIPVLGCTFHCCLSWPRPACIDGAASVLDSVWRTYVETNQRPWFFLQLQVTSFSAKFLCFGFS